MPITQQYTVRLDGHMEKVPQLAQDHYGYWKCLPRTGGTLLSNWFLSLTLFRVEAVVVCPAIVSKAVSFAVAFDG